MAEIIFTPLEKALGSLKRALEQPLNEYTRDATIQRFEYCYELSWKILKRFMADKLGVREDAIKDIYRQAANYKLISDPERWFTYHDARNLTSHTYNENVAEQTYRAAKDFYFDAEALLKTMEERLARIEREGS